MSKITSFIDLIAWQEGHNLVLEAYKATETFPRNAYSLVDQMRRAVVSITSNIAEGFSRRTGKEKSQFYYMSLGSLTELQNQFIIARDLKLVEKAKFEAIQAQTIRVHKLLFGLIKSSTTAPRA